MYQKPLFGMWMKNHAYDIYREMPVSLIIGIWIEDMIEFLLLFIGYIVFKLWLNSRSFVEIFHHLKWSFLCLFHSRNKCIQILQNKFSKRTSSAKHQRHPCYLQYVFWCSPVFHWQCLNSIGQLLVVWIAPSCHRYCHIGVPILSHKLLFFVYFTRNSLELLPDICMKYII